MRHTFPVTLWLGAFLLLAACGEKETPSAVIPAVEVEVQAINVTSAVFTLKTINAAEVVYGLGAALDQHITTGSTGLWQTVLELQDLSPATSYVLTIQGIGPAGEEGRKETFPFQTASGSTLPHPADMTLIPGHSSHRAPLSWSKERWRKHAVYTDENGADHWFFDSFLLIEGQQNGRFGDLITTYSVTSENRKSATREDWQQMLDFWFTGGDFLWQENYWGDGVTSYDRTYTGRTETLRFEAGQLDALDQCITEASATLGPPPTKRYVVMTVPEPIYYDNYYKGVNGQAAKTAYWGSLGGKELDFANVQDRITACKWFMDETRKAFSRKNYKNLELLGFYVLPEVLSTTWRADLKQYDVLIPALSEYAHEGNQWLYWIPYCKAEGYDHWQSFGIDLAYMQPNYYWDGDQKPMRTTFQLINQYKMGLELEFEHTMVENVNGATSAQFYRKRFDEYLSWAKSSGVYGSRSIALYSGTDAMELLADSPLPEDRAMYHKLGHFIIESPLKTR